MCLEKYRTYLEDLDLTDEEMEELIEIVVAVVTRIIDDLYTGKDNEHISEATRSE